MMGAGVTLVLVTLGRSKQLVEAYVVVGDPPAHIDINVLTALDLLDNVPEFLRCLLALPRGSTPLRGAGDSSLSE